MARKPETNVNVAKATRTKSGRATNRANKPAQESIAIQTVHVAKDEAETAELRRAYTTAVDSIRTNAEMMAQAEFRAVNDMYDVLTARANIHGSPPTLIRKVGTAYMICYLQSDGSYGRCRPYTGVV